MNSPQDIPGRSRQGGSPGMEIPTTSPPVYIRPSQDLANHAEFPSPFEYDTDAAQHRHTMRAFSLQEPRTLNHRQSARKVHFQGFLEKRSRQPSGGWKRRYCVLADGEFRYFKDQRTASASDGYCHDPVTYPPPQPHTAGTSPQDVDAGAESDEEEVCIPLDRATAVRTVDGTSLTFQLCLGDELATERSNSITFRAPDRTMYQEWLFSFHSSIISIVTRIVDQRHRSHAARARRVRELGHGHGYHSPREEARGGRHGRSASLSASASAASRYGNHVSCSVPSNLGMELFAFDFDTSLDDEERGDMPPPAPRVVPKVVLGMGEAVNPKASKPKSSSTPSPAPSGRPPLAPRRGSSGLAQALGGTSTPPTTRTAAPTPTSVRPSLEAQVGSGGPVRPDATAVSMDQASSPRVSWTSGVYCEMGVREKNEDTYVILDDFDAQGSGDSLGQSASSGGAGQHRRWAFYGVYDGHCGKEAAVSASEDLHRYIHTMMSAEEPVSPAEAFTQAFARLDREFLSLARQENLYCGSTAVAAIILNGGTQIAVANLGDSAAVLSRGAQEFKLSVAHKPDREDEKERIMAANGWVTEERELFMGQLHRMDLEDPEIVTRAENVVQWVTIARVCGELAVSRSIGDQEFKDIASTPGNEQPPDLLFAFPDGHSGTFSADLLISVPEVQVVDLQPDDQFVVMASDGLWDVLNGQQVIDAVIRTRTERPDLSLDEVAHELCRLAMRLGSADNITVVIIDLEFE